MIKSLLTVIQHLLLPVTHPTIPRLLRLTLQTLHRLHPTALKLGP